MQARAGGGATRDPAAVHKAASAGIAGSGTQLPHFGAIQRAFGHHDVGGVAAHVGGAAAGASRDIGAQAYASGNHVAFRDAPDLFTASHEAAHVIQQRRGVSLDSGVGRTGDAYERHADQVAGLVVQGKSAAELLDRSPAGSSHGVQRSDEEDMEEEIESEMPSEDMSSDEMSSEDGASDEEMCPDPSADEEAVPENFAEDNYGEGAAMDEEAAAEPGAAAEEEGAMFDNVEVSLEGKSGIGGSVSYDAASNTVTGSISLACDIPAVKVPIYGPAYLEFAPGVKFGGSISGQGARQGTWSAAGGGTFEMSGTLRGGNDLFSVGAGLKGSAAFGPTVTGRYDIDGGWAATDDFNVSATLSCGMIADAKLEAGGLKVSATYNLTKQYALYVLSYSTSTGLTYGEGPGMAELKADIAALGTPKPAGWADTSERDAAEQEYNDQMDAAEGGGGGGAGG